MKTNRIGHILNCKCVVCRNSKWDEPVSDTPRTDAARFSQLPYVSIDFARTLERELAEAKAVGTASYQRAEMAEGKLRQVQAERDTLRTQLAEAQQRISDLEQAGKHLRGCLEEIRNVSGCPESITVVKHLIEMRDLLSKYRRAERNCLNES